MEHINDMQEASRKAISMLEPYKKNEPEPSSTSSRRYPKGYAGLGMCHLRALFNVSKSAAEEAKEKKIAHTDSKSVFNICM